MTDKEKAKAYDEAVKKAREIAANPNRILQLDDFEELFPGISDESEDERMINELKGFLYCLGADYFGTGQWQRFLTWLEKQKESLHISETCKENADSFTDEDERIRKWMIDEIKTIYDFESPNLNPMVEKALVYLEKQKEQKPAEWSEEDEKIRRNLMSLLANMRNNRITEGTYQKYYPWLKSLRPSWKPSEEQMQFLLAVINDTNNAGAESCHLTLKSLYDDLKKL